MHTIYLALGSNVGDTQKHITNAIDELTTILTNVRIANRYETKPMYFEEQETFLNTVLTGQTTLSPTELLTVTQTLEKKLGRQKRFRNGPREIDIDILFYDDLILQTETLEIPHPRIAERAFVLKPLMDIASTYLHPKYEKTIEDLYSVISTTDKKERSSHRKDIRDFSVVPSSK